MRTVTRNLLVVAALLLTEPQLRGLLDEHLGVS